MSRTLRTPLPALLTCLALWSGAVPADGQTSAALHVSDDSKRNELVLQLGPYNLPLAGHEGHAGHVTTPAHEITVPISGWLRGYRVELVDGNGRELPRRLLHHMNLIAPERRELFSPIMLRVAAAGQETAPAMLPRLLGMRVERGERLLLKAMLHNPTSEPHPEVYLRVHMPYTQAKSWPKPRSVFPFYMDVTEPAGETHAYDLPPGRSERSWEARPAVSGRILGVSGHLHRYGVALRLEDRTTGKVIWEGKPRVDAEGEITGMPIKRFMWQMGVPIHADHVYRLTAIYENPTGKTIPEGAMGALGGVIMVGDKQKWPGVDPTDPQYALDVKGTTGKAPGEAHEHHAH